MAADSPSTDRVRGVPAEGYGLAVLGSGPAVVAAACEAAERGVRVAAILPPEEPPDRSETPTPLGRAIERVWAASGLMASGELADGRPVDVYRGRSVFLGPRALAVGGQEIRFRKAVLACGTRSTIPEIGGAEESDFLLPETLGQLTAPPDRLAVIGSGAEACAWAQAFRRLGGRVYLVDRRPTLLPGEDAEAATWLATRLERDGVGLYMDCRECSLERMGNLLGLLVTRQRRQEKLLVDRILACTGRVARVDQLGLESAGVACGAEGVLLDDWLRTTNRHIFGAGAIVGSSFAQPQAAEATARLAVSNAMRIVGRRLAPSTVAHVVATQPALVRIGLTQREVADAQIEHDTYRAELPRRDRAAEGPDVAEGRSGEGRVVVHVDRRSGLVLGATIVGEAADELVAPLMLLATRRWPFAALADVIACQPSRFERLVELAGLAGQARRSRRGAGPLGRWKFWRKTSARD